jgi:hypothetical protein
MVTRSSKLPNFPPRAVARLQHEHAIIDAFRQVEDARKLMHRAARELAELIRQDSEGEWQQRWDAFLVAGGVTADELCRWMVHGKQIRQSKRQQHLRLIGGSLNTA